MPDADPAPDRPRRATPRGRRPRFALPADHHEEHASDRTTERIEAFLDGPAPTRRTRRRGDRPTGVIRPRAVVPLESVTSWERALRHEEARIARYGRPATVLIVDAGRPAGHGPDGTGERAAATEANGSGGSAGNRAAVVIDATALSVAIREQARETDHVTRVGPARFHVLLPETDEREATILAERMARAGREALVGDVVGAGGATGGAPAEATDVADVRVAVASPAGGGSLAEALRVAGRRLED